MWYRWIFRLALVALLLLAVFYLPRWWHERHFEQQLAGVSQTLRQQGWENIEVTRDGDRLRLAGKVPVSVQKRRIERLAQRYFEPERIVNAIDVAPPVSPYRFSAKLDDGRLSLQGHAPSRAAIARLEKWIEQHRLRLADDRLRLAEGAPMDWLETAEAALSALRIVGKGDVEIGWRQVLLRGEGVSPGVRAQAMKPLQRLQEKGYDIRYREIPVLGCLDRINAVSIASPLRFEAGQAVISPESKRFLDEMAEVAKSCPQERFAVNGYTDNRGDPVANLRFSQQRAEAVVQALIERGVAKGQFLPLGHGSASPIADNSTEKGRARNRRIEFTPLQEALKAKTAKQ